MSPYVTPETIAQLTAERDAAIAECERLRSDRDCEKRLRKDAEDYREAAFAKLAVAREALSLLVAALKGIVDAFPASSLPTARQMIDVGEKTIEATAP